jgi:hypothetical protein
LRQYLDFYVVVVCILGSLTQFALWRRFNQESSTDAHSNAVRATKATGWIVLLALLATWPWAAHRYDVAIYVVFGLVWLYLASFLMWFLFAATDTSMHVHLLVETFGRKSSARSELRKHYSKPNIIAARVPRLLALGQLASIDGRLRLTGKAVLQGAWIASIARRILGLPARPPREPEPSLPGGQGLSQKIAMASQRFASTSQSIAIAWKRIPSIPFLSLGVWLYFYLPRVWSFGFYNGDWWDLVIARPWDYVGYMFWSRPVSIPFFYWLPQVLGYRPWAWQLMLALCMLVSAWLMYRVFTRLRALLLNASESRNYTLVSDLSVAAFLLFPWTFGWSAWPTILGMGTIGLALFLASLFWLFAPVPTHRAMWLSAFFYALAMLSYEAFYLAFVPLTLIMAGVCITRGSMPRLYWVPFFAFPIVQLLTLAYSRFFSLLAPVLVRDLKPIRWELLDELRSQVVGLPDNLLRAAPHAAELLRFWQAMALLFGIAVILLILRPRTRSRGVAVVAIVGGCLSAIVITLFVYNLASYGMSGVGVMSRTTLSVSFWISMLLFVFLRVAELSWPRQVLQPAAIAAIVALMGGFIPAFNKQHGEWKASWETSLRIMSQMPADEIAILPPEAIIVYVGPTDVGSLQAIDEFALMGWSLHFRPETAVPNNVLKAHSLDVRHNYSFRRIWNGELVHARRFFVKANYHKLDWDGKELHLSLPGYWKIDIPAVKVYEWDQYRSTLREMAPSQPFGEPR